MSLDEKVCQLSSTCVASSAARLALSRCASSSRFCAAAASSLARCSRRLCAFLEMGVGHLSQMARVEYMLREHLV